MNDQNLIARCPALSVRDVLDADGDIEAQPETYRTKSYRFLGNADLPYERYTSPAILQREVDCMWLRVWPWACREEHIPEPGDYVYAGSDGGLAHMDQRLRPTVH